MAVRRSSSWPLRVLMLLLLLGAVYFAYRLLASPASTNTAQTTQALLVRRAVPAYARISSADLFWQFGVHEANVPEDAVRLLSELEGRVALRALRPGEFVLKADLAPPGARPGLTANLDTGYVAVILPQTRLPGAGILTPGDRVDLFASRPWTDGRVETRSIARAARVLVVERAVEEDPEGEESRTGSFFGIKLPELPKLESIGGGDDKPALGIGIELTSAEALALYRVDAWPSLHFLLQGAHSAEQDPAKPVRSVELILGSERHEVLPQPAPSSSAPAQPQD